ncbi:MerR family transcriptional regulator [Plantibacter sp. Leaf171]|uniref:transcriptional regulator FtsR n=1 Tax=unclassified Plantibacter TaxID=2624265 RepID=UPI0006FA1BAA|nr:MULTISPECIES: MerR family transcriptional regulator [unclassified Plantibacter]KQM14957.1 MerR family transcriptional regulator [Plantibacter sp. Leaf1]KQQ51018.1 MerR family transcriptional regulator [Plantibacter sp. Leaf314]KQR58100.1 MerR family transcriptional regulator [Plantibacter sp. Leaf171]
MAAASANARSDAAPLLSIGQVLARLTPEFPELSNSKLRFLEEQGLVSPARTKSGYRKFSSDDLDRLRLILSMQRDHYFPLKVIRTYLVEVDAGRSPMFPGSGQSVGAPSIHPSARRFSRNELIREAGATPMLFNDAVSASLILPAENYGEDVASLLRILVELQRSGIEPRHLRGFRASVEREVGLIESALSAVSKRNDAAGRARTADRAVEIAAQLEGVRSNLVRTALERHQSS